jgi:hypothetical protein
MDTPPNPPSVPEESPTIPQEPPILIQEEPPTIPQEPPILIQEEPPTIPQEPAILIPEESLTIPQEPAIIQEESLTIPQEPPIIQEESSTIPQEPAIVIKEESSPIPEEEISIVKEKSISNVDDTKINIIIDDNKGIKGMLSGDITPMIVINNDTPKIEPIDNRDFSNKYQDATADLVISNEYITRTDSNEVLTTVDKRAEKLIELIDENKRKISNSLYIISCKYDTIYYRYNTISLSILIISTIITFIEAIRLTLINYEKDNDSSRISVYISGDTISLIINCVSLSLSTILTVLSSIVRFKNYKENMDKLKAIHNTIFNYKNLYDREKELIKYFRIIGGLDTMIYDKILNTIEEYNKEIKDISVFENIRNKDILKFNKIKVNHDITLHRLSSKRDIELLKIKFDTEKKKDDINNGKYNKCF